MFPSRGPMRSDSGPPSAIIAVVVVVIGSEKVVRLAPFPIQQQYCPLRGLNAGTKRNTNKQTKNDVNSYYHTTYYDAAVGAVGWRLGCASIIDGTQPTKHPAVVVLLILLSAVLPFVVLLFLFFLFLFFLCVVLGYCLSSCLATLPSCLYLPVACCCINVAASGRG